MTNNANKGFTLLEVLIALTIAGIGLTAVLALGVRSIETSERIERTTQAVLLAQQKMSEFESGAVGMPEEGDEEPFEPPMDLYNWKARYEPTLIEGLQQITLTVSWEGGTPETAVTLDSYVKQ